MNDPQRTDRVLRASFTNHQLIEFALNQIELDVKNEKPEPGKYNTRRRP